MSGHSSQSLSRQMRNGCSVCIRVFKWLPVLFIISVLSWGYYAYVIQLNLFTIDSVILKALYLTLFHVIYILTIWSYWKTIFTDIAHIPRDVLIIFQSFHSIWYMIYENLNLSQVLVTALWKGETVERAEWRKSETNSWPIRLRAQSSDSMSRL
jgi:hypothetical protein